MSWKDAANSALHRVTGYTFTRETSEQRRDAIATASQQAVDRATSELTAEHQRELRRIERRDARRKANRSKRQAERTEKARARRAEKRAEREAKAEAANQERAAHKHARMIARYDEELCATVETVGPQTMTTPAKIAALVEATRYVVRTKVPGAIVECGVWRGGSMQAVAMTLCALGDTDRELHLFDTFEGMPPPTTEDTRTTATGQVTAETLLAESDKDSWMWAVAGLDDVKKVMAETDYPSDKLHFHPGMVEDTTPGEAPETIAILRLDTDWYASTKHELQHLYSRLSPGGVLVLDDYGDWEGARKATDEWLAETGEPIFLAPMGSGCIAVKPLVAGP
jgi:O-methyltransferase